MSIGSVVVCIVSKLVGGQADRPKLPVFGLKG
jgi:hypothetical protein